MHQTLITMLQKMCHRLRALQ